jgi:hypothetical protein
MTIDQDEVAATLSYLDESIKKLLVEIGKLEDGEKPDTHRLRNIIYAMLLDVSFLQNEHAERQRPTTSAAAPKRTGRGSPTRSRRPKSR